MNEGEKRFELTEIQLNLILNSLQTTINNIILKIEQADTAGRLKSANGYRRKLYRYQKVKEIMASLAE